MGVCSLKDIKTNYRKQLLNDFLKGNQELSVRTWNAFQLLITILVLFIFRPSFLSKRKTDGSLQVLLPSKNV